MDWYLKVLKLCRFQGSARRKVLDVYSGQHHLYVRAGACWMNIGLCPLVAGI